MSIPFGVEFTAVVHLHSDSLDQDANAEVGLGVNAVPTVEKVQALIDEAIRQCNEALSTDDFRLAVPEDFGVVIPGCEWPPTS